MQEDLKFAIRFFLVVAGLFFLIVAVEAAMESSNYEIEQLTIGISGGDKNSANFQITDTIGEPITGISSGANYDANFGFWWAVQEAAAIYADPSEIKEDLWIDFGKETRVVRIVNNSNADTGDLNVETSCPEGVMHVTRETLPSIPVGFSVSIDLELTPTGTEGFYHCYIKISNSSLELIVPVEIADETSGEGEYGGESGTGTGQKVAVGRFMITFPDSIDVSVVKGTTQKRLVKILNISDGQIPFISAGVEGATQEFLSFRPANDKNALEIGEEKDYYLYITAPKTMVANEPYYGMILFWDEKSTASLPISITVLEATPFNLFRFWMNSEIALGLTWKIPWILGILLLMFLNYRWIRAKPSRTKKILMVVLIICLALGGIA